VMLALSFVALAAAHFGFNSISTATGTGGATLRDMSGAVCTAVQNSTAAGLTSMNCGLGPKMMECAGNAKGCGPCADAPAVSGVTLGAIPSGANVTFSMYMSENHCTLTAVNTCVISLYYAQTTADATLNASWVLIGNVSIQNVPQWNNTALTGNDALYAPSATGLATFTFTMPTWSSAFTGTIVAVWDVTPQVPHVFFSCADFSGTVASPGTTPTSKPASASVAQLSSLLLLAVLALLF